MKNLQLTLTKDVLKKDHRWLARDFKKGEHTYLCRNQTIKGVEKNVMTCSMDGRLPFFDLPIDAICIEHKDKNYGIFLTEKGISYTKYYAKELPLDQEDLLSRIQKNVHLLEENKNKERPGYKIENEILKVTILKNEIINEVGHMEEINPLF